MTELTGPSKRPTRWWPFIGILCLACAALVYVWNFRDVPRQEKNINSAVIGIATLALSLIWWTLFSRIKWRVRIAGVILVAACLVVGSQLFEITGVSGDLVPIIGLKSSSGSSASLPSNPPVQIKPDDMPPLDLIERPFTQFLGSDRNTQIKGLNASPDHIQKIPKEIWRQPIGDAWSGFVAMEGFVYTQEQTVDQESVTCYAVHNGKLIWRYDYPAAYESVIAGSGPRSTPALTENRIIAVGSTGQLTCLDRSSGELIWSHSVVEDNSAKVPEWGFSPSPLIWQEKVIVPSGMQGQDGLRVYALDTGELERSYPQVPSSYSSPIVTTIADHEIILYFHDRGLAAFATDTDQKIWDHPWGTSHPDVALPVVLSNNRVFISSGYGVGCALLEIQSTETGNWTIEERWKTMGMKAKFTNVVERDGYIYGLDDGIMACVNLETGERQWKQGRYGHGQILTLDNAILLLTERGDIVWLEINPTQAKELNRWHAIDGKTWNPPCLAWPYLLVRNNQEAVCFQFE
jgi:outer membrane protein assembly factor BamB